jgi:hypothetical protein
MRLNRQQPSDDSGAVENQPVIRHDTAMVLVNPVAVLHRRGVKREAQ